MYGEQTDDRGTYLLVGVVVLIAGVVTLATVLGAFGPELDDGDRSAGPGEFSDSYLTGERGSVVT